MVRLIYSAIASLDGYVADQTGSFEWAEPDEEVHRFINELERPIGTYLYGRRLYETMVFWEDPPHLVSEPSQDYASIWQAADKIVYSTTLAAVSSARTRIERSFDPEAIRRMKIQAETDITVGGARLAAEAFRTWLIDECHLFLAPHIVGGGQPALPDNIRVNFELLDQRRFGSGVVHLHYRTRPRP